MPLAAAEAAAINRTAEGWPAGLVLLHGFLSNIPPGQDRLAALSGRQRTELRAHIFDYLAEEVFSRLPEEAPNNRPSAAVLARELSARNLFVMSTDADGSVIRYHVLFREFLLKTA